MQKPLAIIIFASLILTAGCTGFLSEGPPDGGTPDAQQTAEAPLSTEASSQTETRQDSDSDGLTDSRERSLGTNPSLADTDGDGLDDLQETEGKTNATVADTDGDGLDDGEEINSYGIEPTVADSDGDGLDDGEEVNSYETDPLAVDTDDDGLDDIQEVEGETNPTVADTDGDGLADGPEINIHGTDPLMSDTDGDSLTDSEEIREFETNATLADTDSDGLGDAAEIQRYDTSPVQSDTDSDGLDDGREKDIETSATNADTDGDGLPDGAEVEMTDRFPGADPMHKDIFVEVDYTSRLETRYIRDMREEFESAPVSNPDGTTGIELHIYHDDFIRCEDPSGVSPDDRSIEYGCTYEGRTITTGDNQGYYYIQIVSTVQRPASPSFTGGVAFREIAFVQRYSPEYTAHVFMHELGHLLRIQDPGVDSTSRGYSEYPSVMNYLSPDDSIQYADSDWDDINRFLVRVPGDSHSEILNQSDTRE